MKQFVWSALLFCASAATDVSEAKDMKTEPLAKLSTWTLIWEDDFLGDLPDSKTWTRCTRGKPDWKNTMSDDSRLLKVKDGVLHLRGIVNDRKDDDAPYLAPG